MVILSDAAPGDSDRGLLRDNPTGNPDGIFNLAAGGASPLGRACFSATAGSSALLSSKRACGFSLESVDASGSEFCESDKEMEESSVESEEEEGFGEEGAREGELGGEGDGEEEEGEEGEEEGEVGVEGVSSGGMTVSSAGATWADDEGGSSELGTPTSSSFMSTSPEIGLKRDDSFFSGQHGFSLTHEGLSSGRGFGVISSDRESDSFE